MTFDPDELGAETPPRERARLAALADQMSRERPAPGATFRGELRRDLLRDGPPLDRPVRLWTQVALYGGLGAALLAFGALGLS